MNLVVFQRVINMAEPLTKNKVNKECDETCTEDTEIVHLKDLKSALEYLKAKMKGCMTNRDVQEEIEKAFPAIYGNNEGGK